MCAAESPDFRTWKAWHLLHQPFELAWQADNLAEQTADPGFTEKWDAVKAWIEPRGRILDVGCGPRPPFRPCTVIDPLAQAYSEITPAEWWEGVAIHAHAAEHPFIGGEYDTVVCWNCIDHVIGWRKILTNLANYCAPGGRVALATDLWEPFLGHPGFGETEGEDVVARGNRLIGEVERRFRIEKMATPSVDGRATSMVLTPR
jgi:SAM-dependent methyltransferase